MSAKPFIEGNDIGNGGGGQGPSTDRHNNPVVDPTKNVLDLVNAATLRQDDLRKAESKLAKTEREHIRELVKLRAAERVRDVKNISRLEDMRARHAQELRVAEAARIDAIREVDRQAVREAAEVQATQATALATTVATTAEAARQAMAAAAQAQSIALTAALDPMQKSIDDLRQAQYQQQGEKSQQVETRAVTTEVRQATQPWQIWVAGALITLFVLMVTIAAIIYSSNRSASISPSSSGALTQSVPTLTQTVTTTATPTR